jgi:hypothetical protein
MGQKPFTTVCIEAFVVGILLVGLYIVVKYLYTPIYRKSDIHPASISKDPYMIIFLSGALFHILCEYLGINIWYVKEYNKILKNDQ